MKQWESVDDTLDYAIEAEQDAVDLYTDLAAKADTPSTAKIFEEFAGEERGHKAKLQRVKQGARFAPSKDKVLDLKIADYLVDIDPDEQMDYQSALIFAMKQEKAAFRLYSDLAAATDDAELRDIMLALAQEEAKHKLRFEVEYDDHILREN